MPRLLVAPERLADYGITIGDRQRRRLEAAGEFPKRVALTERTYAYVEAELLEYVERQVRARDRAVVAA
jgi:predicted DNA-binding transcriptional regulator AlpA